MLERTVIKTVDKIKKVMACEIKQVGEEKDRVLRFTGSDETPDRDNDIIEAAGWQVAEYLKNPVFLWAHSYDVPPIGKAVNIEKDLAGRKLVFDIKFPTPEELSSDVNNPSEHAKFIDTIYNLYRGGYLSATSVGFRGLKFKPRDDDAMNDKPEWQRGRRYMEQSLLELSAVPVPSNPNALQQAKSAGIEGLEAVEKALEPGVKDFELDTENNVLKVNQNGEVKSITFEFLKALDGEEIKDYAEWKSGATLSAKNKALLNEIHDSMEGCRKKLRDFLDAAMPMDTANMTAQMTGPMMMPMEPMTAMRTLIAEEVKGALERVLSLLSTKDAPKVDIDLAAIEFPKAQPNAADIELPVEPEELKNMIEQAIDKRIQGGN